MASVPSTTKSGAGAGGILVALLVIALALGAGHHYLAVSSSGGGGSNVIPHLIGTPGDPCRDQPDGHEVKTVYLPGRSRQGRVRLDCGQWRQIVRRSVRGGAGGRATIRQILACIQAAVHRGEWQLAASADNYSWHWGPGQDDFALVVADATGRIRLAVPGAGETAWAQCAKAAG